MVNNRDREVLIDVTSRHQQVSEKTRDHAQEKVAKLSKFNDRISRIQVLLEEEHGEFTTEVIVHVESATTLVGKETASGYRASIDAAVEKLERQLKRDKEKRRNHKHDPLGSEMPDRDDDGIEGEEDSYEDAVRQDLQR